MKQHETPHILQVTLILNDYIMCDSILFRCIW